MINLNLNIPCDLSACFPLCFVASDGLGQMHDLFEVELSQAVWKTERPIGARKAKEALFWTMAERRPVHKSKSRG
jgi:hypothetical protein